MGRWGARKKTRPEAKRPLASKSPKHESARGHELEQRLAESLQRERATGEILRTIRNSPTDVGPVAQAIADTAGRLCACSYAAVFRFDGELIHWLAARGANAAQEEALRAVWPRPVGQDTLVGRTILAGEALHIEDVSADPTYTVMPAARTVLAIRSVLNVPILRQGRPVGVIGLIRSEVRPFSPEEVSLVETFADQAVVAIENVRLFEELEKKSAALTETLEQQTATSEILKVISRSPTDVQPVFDAVAESAARLCEAFDAVIFRVHGEGLVLVAHHGPIPLGAVGDSVVLTREIAPGRSVIDGRVVHVADLQHEAEDFPRGSEAARRFGFRTTLNVPLMRDGNAIGVITVRRTEAELFAERQVALLQTFADQAVIAIENVRLFTELQARTGELTRSVEKLTALGEVGQAISSTLDLGTVLSTIVARATQLSGSDAGVIYEYDEEREVFVPRASEHLDGEIVETMLATPVRKGEGATGRLAEVAEPIQLGDIQQVAAESRVRGALVLAGYRAFLAVPLVRDDRLLGGLTVIRKTTGEFPLEVVELLRTFATQSALAIQNARLFLEIGDKSRQLESASRHKSEFLANMSHELRTPLNAIMGFSEVLGERMFGELNDKQDEYLKDIHASGQHLLALINDILDLSKIEAGRMELEIAAFDLPIAIEHALTLVRERAGRRGIALDQAVDGRLGSIQGDERKIKQVLLNLLSNALKFTPEGGRIDVRAAFVDGMAEVAVADTGVGIAPEDQEAVFEEFRQVGTADKKGEGTGLGLTLSRKFIELHGGRIWVQSQVGVGSTFTFTIPVRRSE